MTAPKKCLTLFIAVLAAIIVVEQCGANLSFSFTKSATSTSDLPVAKTEKTFELVSIDYPLWRWLPLIKTGETVIRHNYYYPYPRDCIERQAVTRTRVTVFGLMSTSKYEEAARKEYEAVSAKYKKGR